MLERESLSLYETTPYKIFNLLAFLVTISFALDLPYILTACKVFPLFAGSSYTFPKEIFAAFSLLLADVIFIHRLKVRVVINDIFFIFLFLVLAFVFFDLFRWVYEGKVISLEIPLRYTWIWLFVIMLGYWAQPYTAKNIAWGVVLWGVLMCVFLLVFYKFIYPSLFGRFIIFYQQPRIGVNRLSHIIFMISIIACFFTNPKGIKKIFMIPILGLFLLTIYAQQTRGALYPTFLIVVLFLVGVKTSAKSLLLFLPLIFTYVIVGTTWTDGNRKINSVKELILGGGVIKTLPSPQHKRTQIGTGRYSDDKRHSAAIRIKTNAIAIDRFLKDPIDGTGVAGLPLYEDEFQHDFRFHTHSHFLLVLASYGILGMIPFLLFWGGWLKRLMRISIEAQIGALLFLFFYMLFEPFLVSFCSVLFLLIYKKSGELEKTNEYYS